jgi:DNA modification methylase
MIPISKLKLNPTNPRTIKKDQLEKLKRSIKSFPEMMEKRPMVCVTDEDGKLYPLGGNMRLRAIKEMGLKEVPETWVALADEWTEEQRREFIVKDNANLGAWDFDALADGWNIDDLDEWGVDLELDEGYDELGEEQNQTSQKLSDRFLIPPFSVLDTRQGIWQDRKRWWLSLGIKSELGRDAVCISRNEYVFSDGTKFSNVDSNGTSVFDPVLCELSYLWFNIPKGKILDPFAGGSVRGIVAAKLGYEYLGNDLRKEQIEANRINATEVLRDSELYPVWTVGDSLNIDKIAEGYEADMIFSCPPYADLEVYSDDERDISNMSYSQFLEIYREIIRKSCDKLKEDRFAVFVVGDVRDKKGFYYDFISDTKKIFIDCGVKLYNELILVEMVGNLQMRAGRYMKSGRKVGKQHQNVLVFYKGDPKKIKQNYPELDLSYIEDQIEE